MVFIIITIYMTVFAAAIHPYTSRLPSHPTRDGERKGRRIKRKTQKTQKRNKPVRFATSSPSLSPLALLLPLSLSLSISRFFPLSLYLSHSPLLPCFLLAQSPSHVSLPLFQHHLSPALPWWGGITPMSQHLLSCTRTHMRTHKCCGHLNPCCSGQHVAVSRTSRWHIFGRWKSEAACCCVAVFTLKASLGKRNSFLPHYSICRPLLFFLHQSSFSFTAPFPGLIILLFSSLFFVDQCISLSLARFSPAHEQDLFLIDAPCSIKVTPPPITFYAPVFCFF